MIENIMKFIAEKNLQTTIFWDEELKFFVDCSDFFFWATSDCEELTEEDLPLLNKSIEEAGDELTGALLYCARKRKMRPQGAYYSILKKETWHLFDACGEKREKDNKLFGNPSNKPEE